MAWIEIGSQSDFPVGESRELVAADRIVAVFNVDGTLHAMDGSCPHQGGPLGKGELDGCILTCPWHGLRFDVRDGQNQLNKSSRQPTFAMKVEAGRVFIEVGGR